MLRILIEGETLDLPADATLEIEETSPIFNERGSQSMPLTVPPTPRNRRILGFPTRPDTGFDPNIPHKHATVIIGSYIRSGLLNVQTASNTDGISFNIGFDNSTAYAKWVNKKLANLSTLPVYEPTPPTDEQDLREWDPMRQLIRDMNLRYRTDTEDGDPLAVFPILVAKDSVKEDNSDTEKPIYEILNYPYNSNIKHQAHTCRCIDGKATKVSQPNGYGITPFVRVWYILKLIFDDLGVEMESNPFYENPDLRRLTTLNNAADCLCIGKIKYSDLMPSCTVEEFLNALWVRFGLIYNINLNRNSVSFRFLRDIINDTDGQDITDKATGCPLITYETPQYVKLSADTSIEGAEPPTETLEEFTAGIDSSRIAMGAEINKWKPTIGKFDGDINDGVYGYDPDLDYDDRDDGRDPDDRDPDVPDPWDDYEPYSRAASTTNETSKEENSGQGGRIVVLGYEFITGQWAKLDVENQETTIVGSSFFNWDPKTEGCDAFELTSDDQWVPLVHVNTGDCATVEGLEIPEFKEIVPAYLVGSRHYHTQIKGQKEDSGDTPLAFMFAYPFPSPKKYTFGRLCPETSNGTTADLKGSAEPELSLFFQYGNGLFATFWKEFDEMLRHGNRLVEVTVMMPQAEALALSPLHPVWFKGVKCLLDSATYALSDTAVIEVSLKLRTVTTTNEYNIDQEQNIPKFLPYRSKDSEK